MRQGAQMDHLKEFFSKPLNVFSLATKVVVSVPEEVALGHVLNRSMCLTARTCQEKVSLCGSEEELVVPGGGERRGHRLHVTDRSIVNSL